jgi:hypothetical protein
LDILEGNHALESVVGSHRKLEGGTDYGKVFYNLKLPHLMRHVAQINGPYGQRCKILLMEFSLTKGWLKEMLR